MPFGLGKRQKKGMISLENKSFILWGYLKNDVTRLKQQVETLGGEIVSINRISCIKKEKKELFVLCNYWCDVCLPQSHTDLQYIYVTEFWLDQMINERKWLNPRNHFFFQPPHMIKLKDSPLPQIYKKLSYPIEYLVENNQDSKKKVLMPCSPTAYWEKQVPMWPYVTRFLMFLTSQAKNQEDIMLFFQWITANSLDRLECLSKALSDMSVMSTNALDLLEMFQIMAQVALELPFLFPIAPSLLFAVEESTKDDCIFHIKNVHLTKRQVFALLVHAFFTTFPDQSEHTGKEFPFFDMRSLFGSATRKDPPWSKTLLVQKLLTILAYFECMSNILKRQNDVLQNEILSYSRVSMELSLLKIQNVVQLPKQGVLHLQMSNILEKLFVNSKMFSFMIESNVNGGDGGKLIEDCMDCVQVDFANAFAGGGIFGRGCVQEEIRFLISPELMISCLLMEKLQDHEAFFIEGSERIAKYIGYGSSYRYNGRYEDKALFEQVEVGSNGQFSKRRLSAVVGIDAINYSSQHISSNCNTTKIQYQPPHIKRELIKAIVGFYLPINHRGLGIEECDKKIATGNWGCGVFGGDPELKFLIQWLAASIHRKQLVYVVFEDTNKTDSFTNQLNRLRQLFQQKPQLFIPKKVLEFLLIHLQELLRGDGFMARRTIINNTAIPTPVSDNNKKNTGSSILQLAILFFNS